ncbi:ComEC/Rec2 family competence protein [uncultured Clostridium sp.]|uniref:ComEC/Rec2 family competence protein n=1 Tax=uncultured Clostridium sp. TaxID=59620 RepID=UPI0025E39257|nr:ComEC/Rec2 family competence protein [uncultured Clostridium sp.]MDU4883607.1 ComEC/Rec2 family competence protein [Clostridium celatum]MDU7076869.1 ComEC/Rec2 family competence protein [Clostridium celatum]
MDSMNNQYFNNPLPYVFIVFILSYFSYEMYSKNAILASFYVVSFFIFIMYFKGKYIMFILVLFFIIALNNTIYFYNYTPKEIEEIRITDVKGYYGKGEVNGRIVNLSNVNENIEIGNKLLVKGKFSENKNISNGVIGDYKIEDYKVLKSDFIDKLYKRRKYVFECIESKLGQRKAALITSVSFGYKSELNQDHQELMKNLGISHVISVSGLHLVLVYSVLRRFLGVRLSLVLALVYVLFSGASAPAVRAYIMIVILNLGKIVKRNYNPIASLSLAGIILLLMKPYYTYNLGFVLSFLATLGIILFNKDLNKRLYKLPNSIRNTIAISLSAQILTLPIIILYFNEVSLNFIVGNIVIIPFMNILVVLGNILIFIVEVPRTFNYIIYICHYIIKYIDIIMYKIDNMSFELIYFHYTVAYFYIALLITYYFYKKGFKRFIYYPLIIFFYILVIIYSPLPKIRYYNEGGLLISYKGERVLIQTKDEVDEKKLMLVSLASNISEDFNEIIIGEEIKIKRNGENFILQTLNNNYLLFVNYEKLNNDYDIIDFRKGDIKEIVLFKGEIINN